MRHQNFSSSPISYAKGDPREQCQLWLRDIAEPRGLLVVDFTFESWWLKNPAKQELAALYLYSDGQLHCAVTDKPLVASEPDAAGQFFHWVREHELFSAIPGQPLPLLPTYIEKPWGREVWFTGVEERGVCQFGDQHTAVAIPWLQAVLPGTASGTPGEPLVLLKILDPAPREVVGDLYFELHEEKREVYVVTHVDPEAWPDGTGYIRYGFDSAKIAAAGSESAFRRDYLAAVQAYEQIRRDIDAQPDDYATDQSLLDLEVKRRRDMEAFTQMRPLRVGDVVVVPLLMPHSLQHGVRTIEFQTPVYERKILSFAQRVLTQGHWDTAAAVEQMRLEPPAEEPFTELPHAPGVSVERIVDFEDFEVRRVRIDAGSCFNTGDLPGYGVVMVVEGEMSLDDRHYGPEQALLIPGGKELLLASAQLENPLILLLALPRS